MILNLLQALTLHQKHSSVEKPHPLLHIPHPLESYSEIQTYKYCFLNDKNGVRITNNFGILGTVDEETDEQMDDEVEVDVDLVS